jgi:hypothetical protein
VTSGGASACTRRLYTCIRTPHPARRLTMAQALATLLAPQDLAGEGVRKVA